MLRFVALYFVLTFALLHAQEGVIDPLVIAAPDGPVRAMLTQRDGKIIIVGDFTHLGSTPANRIARLNFGGTIDTTFAAGVGANGPIHAIIADPNGSNLYIGGEFTTYAGASANRLASIRSDGSLITTWLGTGTNGPVYALGISSSLPYFLVGGDFTTINGQTRNRIALLTSSGGLLSGFAGATSGANGAVRAITTSGSAAWIGGDFTSLNGQARNRVALVNISSGTNTASFNPPAGLNGPVHALALGADFGTLYIGGAFTQVGSGARPGLAALHASTGAEIASFTPTANGPVHAILPSSTGDALVVAGDFTELAGQPVDRIGRLLGGATWTLSPSFAPGGADASVRCLASTYDDKTLLGGEFVQAGGASRPALARIYGAAGTNPPGAPSAPLVGGETDTSLVTLYSGASLAYGYKIDRSPDGAGDWIEIASDVPNSTVYPDLGLAPGTTYFYRFRAYNSNGVGAPSPVASGTTFAQAWQHAGATDPAFNATLGAGANGFLEKVLPLADGTTLVAGSFTTLAGQSRKNIARLLPDGSVDPSFNPGAGPSSSVSAAALQPDGKILIGGSFTSFAGVTRNRIARLHPDGSLDTTFDPATGPNRSVNDLIIQPDGAILVAGDFSTINGLARAGIARLTSTGAFDPTFDPGEGLWFASAYRLALQPDGKVVVVGFFSEADGVERGNIARFLPDGTLDTAFATGDGADSWVESVHLLPDGKLLIAGPFHSYDGVPRAGLARLFSDGSLDPTFNPGSGLDKGWAHDAVAQPDGKIIAGGWFTVASGKVRLRLARFHADGGLDETFQPGLSVNSTVHSLALLPDGKLLIGGSFTTLAGTPLRGLARLLGDSGQTLSAYAQWAADNGLAPDAAATGDDDHDGLPNLLEYALGSRPADPASVALPAVAHTEVVEGAPAYLTFTYTRARAGLAYRVEASDNLQTWSDAEVDQGDASGETVTARVTLEGGSRFLRLVVTAP